MPTKFSPGPWTDISDSAKESKARRMALVSTGNSRQAIDVTGSGENYAQDRANAALVSRAPVMHAALIEASITLKEALEDLDSAEVHVWGDDEHPESQDDCRYCCTRVLIVAALDKIEKSLP